MTAGRTDGTVVVVTGGGSGLVVVVVDVGAVGTVELVVVELVGATDDVVVVGGLDDFAPPQPSASTTITGSQRRITDHLESSVRPIRTVH
ncbi:MAG TPA: hypothetical protein VFR41_00640 [Acidimicrobiia bacterium]|nr:hypothetical protein [Acidimicrobiia bacterium]